MLLNYFPIYEISLSLQRLRVYAEIKNTGGGIAGMPAMAVSEWDSRDFRALLEKIQNECPPLGLMQPSEIAESIIGRPAPQTYRDLYLELTHLSESLSRELKKEIVFRIPPDRKMYFEHDDLFGSKVGVAFPSCRPDIQKAGSCYALGQEDACVHHLMLVLERGLNALAVNVGVSYQRTNWQNIIDQIAAKLKSAPKGPERDFYIEVNAQFGFLKDAYRNHSEHARDDHYDILKALSILNHVRAFMQELEKGGLAES